jgi:hypothetical protein
MSKPGKGGRSTNNLPPQSQARDDTTNYKINNKKLSNKSICPFACPNCQSLGRDLVKSKYKIVNILLDTGDSIFSPMQEKYHDDEVNSVRNTGQVFLSADLVDSFFQKGFKK